MTKPHKTEPIPPIKTAKPRQLNKQEEEEYTRLMNEAWQKISKSIEAGQIQAPWWREES